MLLKQNIKLVWLLPLFFQLFTSCQDLEEVESISVSELEQIIKNESTVQILDVRTAIEQDSGIILNAKRVNYLSNSFVTKSVEMLDKAEPVYIYCRSGRRSKVACRVLLDKGYEVYNVEGGYKAWQQHQEQKIE